MKRMMARLAAVVLAAALAGACAGSGPKKPPTGTPEPDKFLYDRGTENLAKKRWIVAREYFRQLVDSYPQSPYRADAKLGIGDTYMGEKSSASYVLAINEYREFLSFYPTHKRADYAQYQLALGYFKQMRSPMRDQTETRDAIRELTAFLTKFPSAEASTLYPEAKQRLREAKDRLDDWDAGVGEQYFRLKWYPGAMGRLEPLIKSDPEYSRRDKVYYLLGETLMRLNRQAEALVYFERLVAEFEQSDHLEQAKKRVAEIKAAAPATPGKDTAKGQRP
jgi:outer membrane protein assembly factor BamD